MAAKLIMKLNGETIYASIITFCIFVGKHIVFKGTRKQCDDEIVKYPSGYIDRIF
jgi:hypothetical protein